MNRAGLTGSCRAVSTTTAPVNNNISQKLGVTKPITVIANQVATHRRKSVRVINVVALPRIVNTTTVAKTITTAKARKLTGIAEFLRREVFYFLLRVLIFRIDRGGSRLC